MIYYTYCPKKFVFLKAVEADTQPEHSSIWAPPETDDYTQAYFDGNCWIRALAHKFLAPELLRAAHITLLRRDMAKAMKKINANESPDEIATYPQQYAEAVIFGTTGTLGPFLTRLSEVRNMAPSDLVARVMANVNTYGQLTAEVVGAYRNAVAALPEKPELTQDLLRSGTLNR